MAASKKTSAKRPAKATAKPAAKATARPAAAKATARPVAAKARAKAVAAAKPVAATKPAASPAAAVARRPARAKPAAAATSAAKPAASPAAAVARPVVAATRAATPPARHLTARPAPAAPLRAAPVTAPPAPPVDHHARIAELWRRLEAWVAMTGAPPLALAPGAPEKAIAAAEKTMKLAFPHDFRASLAIHDGQLAADGGPPFPWMAGCGPLLPLAEVVARWREEQDLAARKAPRKDVVAPTDKLRAGVHRAGRVPIARTAGRDPELTFLDLDPGPAGTRGQLATMVSRAELVVIDTGFAPALERWVNVLERGLWSYDRERHVAHPRALAPATSHPAGLFSRR